MSDKLMREVHKLIAEERYRDARGILETEDINPDVAEKWIAWLNDLHRDEWVQVGMVSEKKTATVADETREHLSEFIGGLILAALAAIGVAWVINAALTGPGFSFGAVFLLFAIPLGYIGWFQLINLVNQDHAKEAAALTTFVLLCYLLTSGLPWMYWLVLPLNFAVAGFALVFPGAGYLSWRAGAMSGRYLTRLLAQIGSESKR